MKPAFPVILTVLSLTGISAIATGESVARFSNNDRLAGTLESLSSEFLLLKSEAFEKPIPFYIKNVIDLSLSGEKPNTAADHDAILTLTNGDTVRGQLASVTDEIVCLDTWFAGRMNFKRMMVSSVKIERLSSLLYQGPTGLDGWTQSGDTPAWTYGYSAFRSNNAGSIARNELLADECSITFETAWKGDSIALKVILFSDDPPSANPGTGYEITFQRGSISLRNSKNQSYLGSTHSQALMENDKVKVEIRASRKSGKFCLFINGRLIEVWSDPDVAKEKLGTCLHFVAQNAMPIRISQITVAPWDGTIDQVPEPRRGIIRRFNFQPDEEDPEPELEPTKPEIPQQTRMDLANGDSLDGEVISIEDGLIAIKSSLGDIKLPVNRLSTLALKQVGYDRSIRRNGDIRAWFPDGSSMVFRLDSTADGSIIGSSQNFGSATFKMNAFNRIEFNIYDVALEDKRASQEW